MIWYSSDHLNIITHWTTPFNIVLIAVGDSITDRKTLVAFAIVMQIFMYVMDLAQGSIIQFYARNS